MKVIYQTIDEESRKQIDALKELSMDDISTNRYHAFGHELVKYGIDSVAHMCLMNSAMRELIKNKGNLDDFVKENGLSFNGNRGFLGFKKLQNFDKDYGVLANMRKQGLYIPLCIQSVRFKIYSFLDEDLVYFSPDYYNRFYDGRDNDLKAHEKWDGSEIPIDSRLYFTEKELDIRKELIEKRNWSKEDLTNTELIMKGIVFSRALWRNCVKSFTQFSESRNQPANFTNAGKKLIDYYTREVFQEQ
ncbi:MAG TPA: hypothetical protein P5277_02025 [Candidatus Paceibacterota bacterium]|nr:hypothetical protein [Candidatus Paceibacterota bacterium]